MKPDYVSAWERATDRVAELYGDTKKWKYLWPMAHNPVIKGWVRVPDLSDPRWLSDVLEGLMVKKTFCIVIQPRQDGADVMLVEFPRDKATGAWLPIRGAGNYSSGPDIPSALCAAVTKARQAG